MAEQALEKENPRRELARQLAAQGKTYAEIGKILNPDEPLSRQRVHQLLTGYKSPWNRNRQQNQGKTAA